MSESDWLRRLIDWSMDYSGPSLGLQKGQLQLPFGRDEERSWTVAAGKREQVRLDVLLTGRGGQLKLTVPLMPDPAPHDPRLWRPIDDDFYDVWLWEDEDGISLRRAGLSPMVAGPSPPTACWTAEVQMAPWVGADLPFVESELLLLAPDPGAVREVVLPPLRLVADLLHADEGQVDAASLGPLAQAFLEVARHLCSLASPRGVEASRCPSTIMRQLCGAFTLEPPLSWPAASPSLAC